MMNRDLKLLEYYVPPHLLACGMYLQGSVTWYVQDILVGSGMLW